MNTLHDSIRTEINNNFKILMYLILIFMFEVIFINILFYKYIIHVNEISTK